MSLQATCLPLQLFAHLRRKTREFLSRVPALTNPGSPTSYGRGAGVGRGLGVGVDLGETVGVAVGVGGG
jgi:hypothetical protein